MIFKRKSVDSILAPLRAIHHNLHAHAAALHQEVEKHDNTVTAAIDARHSAVAEREVALAAAARVGTLIGG